MKYPEIAKRFNLVMNLRHIKAVDLAKKAGISAGALSHYCNGNRCPSTDIAIKLGKILNCNPVWLMDLDNEMEVSSNIVATTEYVMDDDTKYIVSKVCKMQDDQRKRILTYLRAIVDSEET